MKILTPNWKNSRIKKNPRIILKNSEITFDKKDQNLGRETLNHVTPCPAFGIHLKSPGL